MTMKVLGRTISLVVALALAGCATGPQQPEVAVADPPPDGSTACYDQARLPFYHTANTALLVDKQQEHTKQVGQAVAAAGLILTIATLPVGGVGGSVARGIGAAMVVGGALAASVQTDQQLIADVSRTFSGLVQCRQGEAREVRQELRSRRIKAAEARERLRGLRDLMVTDADVAHQVNAALARRNQVYMLEVSKIETEVPKDPAEAQKHVAEVNQAKQTIQTSQHALTDQASQIDKAAQTITVSSIQPSTSPT